MLISNGLRLIFFCLLFLAQPISFHGFRHTCATILLYNGVQLTTVQKLLGHQSIRTTEVYSDIMDMTVIRDLQKIKQKKNK